MPSSCARSKRSAAGSRPPWASIRLLVMARVPSALALDEILIDAAVRQRHGRQVQHEALGADPVGPDRHAAAERLAGGGELRRGAQRREGLLVNRDEFPCEGG